MSGEAKARDPGSHASHDGEVVTVHVKQCTSRSRIRYSRVQEFEGPFKLQVFCHVSRLRSVGHTISLPSFTFPLAYTETHCDIFPTGDTVARPLMMEQYPDQPWQ